MAVMARCVFLDYYYCFDKQDTPIANVQLLAYTYALGRDGI